MNFGEYVRRFAEDLQREAERRGITVSELYEALDKEFKEKYSNTSKQKKNQELFSEVTHEVLNDKSLRASKDRRIKQLRGANKDRNKRTTI